MPSRPTPGWLNATSKFTILAGSKKKMHIGLSEDFVNGEGRALCDGSFMKPAGTTVKGLCDLCYRLGKNLEEE